MTQKVYETLLKPDPDKARAELEDLASERAPGEYAAGKGLRAVAAEMVRCG